MSVASESAGSSGWTVWNQLAVQLTGLFSTIALSAIATIVICIVVDKTISFRVDEETEVNGLDYSLHGEH